MQTYFPDTATAADPGSAKALGGEPLRPNGNTAGLLSVSPSLLTTISSLPELENADSFMHVDPAHGINTAAPISVIRVKLTGHIGLDPASQARLRLVAQEIYQRTGLHVDITEGSSPAPVTVTDPAGKYGRPELQLSRTVVTQRRRRAHLRRHRPEDPAAHPPGPDPGHRVHRQRGCRLGPHPQAGASRPGLHRLAAAIPVRPDPQPSARCSAAPPGSAARRLPQRSRRSPGRDSEPGLISRWPPPRCCSPAWPASTRR